MADILGEKNICKKCGKCCRLIHSLKSYQDFCEESKNGDSVAVNFLKLFLPYESLEEALAIDSDCVNGIIEHHKRIYGEDTSTYFYHCRYIAEDNTCKVYDMRPKFCRHYPKNEFIILPQDCSYEGYSFMRREKIKAKVRKAKEQLLDIKVMRQKVTDRATLEKLNKLEKQSILFVDQYKYFGSGNW